MTNPEYFDLLRRLSQPILAAALPHTLAHVTRLLETLGSPQTRFPSVVVAGSTGKGTTCVRLADYLSITGRKIGLYTSPHLHSFRERFAILHATDPNVGARRAVPSPSDSSAEYSPPLYKVERGSGDEVNRRISQPEFVELARAVLAAEESLDTRYSTFESATALALLWFAQQQVDIAVLEVGIGGRFDAVNAVANVLAVLTPIEAEHVTMLGGSIESVAWHKAGIIQPNGKAITVPQSPEVIAVLEREAAEKNATLQIADDPVEEVSKNEHFFPPSPRLRGRGVGGEGLASLPGRLERIAVGNHTVIIDGGHTPAAARHLRDFLSEVLARQLMSDIVYPVPIRFIVGMLRDKNVAAYLATFDEPRTHFVYTQAPGDRALTSAELLERFRPAHGSVTLAPSLSEALASVEAASEALIVVAGSLRMAAAAREAFGLLSPDELEEARLTRAIFEGDEYQSKLKDSR